MNRYLNQRNLEPIINVMLGLSIPIIILNLVFANYNDSSCLHHQVQKANLDLTLKTWLSIYAYVLIGVVAFFGASVLLKKFSRDIGNKLEKFANWLIIPVALFIIAWTIIGAIMFWGELSGTRGCDLWLTIYMWVLLILGCLSIVLVIFNVLNIGK